MFAAVTRHLQHHRLLNVPAVTGHGEDFGRGERSDDAAFEWWSMRRRAVVVSAFNRAILLPNTYPRDDVGQIFRGAIATAKPMGTVSTGGTEVSELDRLDGTARTADTVVRALGASGTGQVCHGPRTTWPMLSTTGPWWRFQSSFLGRHPIGLWYL